MSQALRYRSPRDAVCQPILYSATPPNFWLSIYHAQEIVSVGLSGA